jgi:TRAP-type C4-dicarboxylate transport system permease small subunit
MASSSRVVRCFGLVDRVIALLETATLVVACVALFAIMLLVFLDAVLRYALNSPLKFTADIVTLYLISCALLLVLSYTLRRGGHINVDLFVHIMPPRLYDALMGIVLVGATVVVGIMAYQVTVLSWESWQANELTVGIYAWPLWLSKATVAISLVILDLRLLHVGLTHLAAAITGDPALAVSVAHAEDQPLEEPV